MTTLVLALLAEGNTDRRFLPILIQRTAAGILADRGRTVVDVLDPVVVEPEIRSAGQANRMRSVAGQVAGYHALMIHIDADDATPHRALDERFRPGADLIHQAHLSGEFVCNLLIPIVPVHMVEAWMLADTETLRIVIGTTASAEDLGVTSHAHEVEANADPKHMLREVVRRAYINRSRRRRGVSISDLYEPLARQISLNRLRLLPSYQRFQQDLTDALIRLNMID